MVDVSSDIFYGIIIVDNNGGFIGRKQVLKMKQQKLKGETKINIITV